jgi:hypothetical protein
MGVEAAMDGEPRGHLHCSGAPAAGQAIPKPVLTFDQIINVQQLKAGRCVVRSSPPSGAFGLCCACSSREPAIHP